MIGQMLNGRYRVLQLIGEGSTATVYRALDTRLNREVALKILLPHVREATHQRFLQEAKASARLNHPHIMSIYDINEDDGRHFLVVELVDGNPLTDYVPSPPEVVADIGAQISSALYYAHQRGIIHRDIKPANIKVTEAGQVKIMDMGLALPPDAKRYTAIGMVVGTPAYISPEQAQGHELDPRTDIYSLGIVLYELATGRLPFEADNIMALLLQHIQRKPRQLIEIARDFPLQLNRVILKALEKNPENRFADAHEMSQALYACAPHLAPTQASLLAASESLPDQMPIGVILADDHTLMRQMIGNFLAESDEYVILAEASDGNSALEQTLEIMPDLLILDLNMPYKGGLDILPEIRQKAPHVKVLILTGREDDGYIVRALRAGAHGYILKSIDQKEFMASVRRVMADEIVLGQGIVEKAVVGLLGHEARERHLTAQECHVLLHVAAGYENTDIAEKLGQGTTAIIEILASAMDKVGAIDRNDAALKALRRGDILLEDLHKLSRV